MNKKTIFSLCLGLLMTLMALPAMAQTRTVKGVVVDNNDEPIIGATVTVSGNTKQGTVTDFNGNFTIQVPEGKKIKVSYIGFQTQVVGKLDGKVKVVLEEDENTLDDVVVVGYGALKQKNVTGAVEVINPEELKDLSVSNLSEALIGLSPSLHVSLPSTGRPGENATITIRAARDAVALIPTTDMNGAAAGGNIDPRPLYVIDDFIYQDGDKGEEEFNNLDVDEVESITILKDASAAIYGAYGAYGVILVKTKRGKAGKPRISYQTQLGWVDAVMHADMLDGYNYGRIYNAAKAANALQNNKTIDRRIDLFQADELEAMKYTNYDLLDKYWSSSLSQRHSINVNGGNDKATYFAGVTYQTQDGNIGKLDYDRWNYRAGITANINQYVKATLSVSGDDSRKNMHMTSSSGGGNQEDYLYMMKNPSYVPDEINGYPIYHSGMENDPSFKNYYNYKSLYNSINNREVRQNSMSIQGTLEADFSFIKPLKGLRARLTYSRNVGNSHDNRIKMENTVYRVKNRGGSGNHLYVTDPTAIIGGPDAVYNETTLEGFRYTAFENLEERILNSGQDSYIENTMSRNTSYQLNFMLMYGRKFGKHDVSGTFSIERGESETFNQWARGTHPLPFTDGTSNSLADDTQKDATWQPTENGNLAYIGRLNYAYDDRYLFEFLVRAQASAAKFAPENYWGAFPSVSAGWVASEEKWFPKEKLKIDFLKFRASFGIMGRDNVDAWRWLQLYAYNPSRGSIFGTDVTKESARAFQLPEKSGTNRDLHWDKNIKMNFGIDLRMLDSRLSLSLDGYYDKGREMFAVPNANYMPSTVGTYPAPENYSEMDMWGMEAIVGWRQRINKDMYVSARLGFSYDDNKVKKYYWDVDPKLNSIVYGERSDRGLWGLSCLGMFRTYQEIEEYFQKYKITSYLGLTQDQVHPGMLIYEDVRGPKDDDGNWTGPDGKISTDDDIVRISKRQDNPYKSNLNLNFVWKSFSLNATFQAEWGAYRMMPNMYQEDFGKMETTNVSAMWNDMFIYEDVLDAEGRVIAYANPDGRWPNLGLNKSSVNTQRSTFWKMSAAEIALRNISVAYTLPKNIVKTIGLNAVRFNVTVQNALSLYNACPGGYWDNFAGTYGSYPVTRKVTFGMNVTF
ncbi:MAG: TonB-dependent receptor [Prevotella sp.]|nr:TonB-dependent receptor [Prevotella sp.]